MKATILHYTMPEGTEHYSIGSKASMEQIKKTSRQVVRVLEVDVTEEERYHIGDMNEEDMLDMLENSMNESLFTFNLQ